VSVNDNPEKAICHWDFPRAFRIVLESNAEKLIPIVSGGFSRIRRMILK
jgi:hypothetical protein